jgi:hypothetical protein
VIKISHRGLIKGPNPIGENNPVDLIGAISMGFDVEADIWLTDGGFFLGHDSPEHPIDIEFIEAIKDETWFHCKNIDALSYFTNEMPEAKFFWHQNDDHTLTSNGYIWTYPGKPITNKSIVVLLEPTDLTLFENAYGVCTKYLFTD